MTHFHIQKQSLHAYGRTTEPPSPGRGRYIIVEHDHSLRGLVRPHEHYGVWGLQMTRSGAEQMEEVYRRHVEAVQLARRIAVDPSLGRAS